MEAMLSTFTVYNQSKSVFSDFSSVSIVDL